MPLLPRLGTSLLAQAADLTVDVAGVKSARGRVKVGVYNRAEDFLKLPLRTAAVAAQAGSVSVRIAGLPPG